MAVGQRLGLKRRKDSASKGTVAAGSRSHRIAEGLYLPLPVLFLVLLTGTAAAAPEGPKLGRPASPEDIAAENVDVFPDGTGLPPGRGTAAEGKTLYEARCASCHGARGMGGSAMELAGGSPLTSPHPDRTIGTYWPYATTIFDYIRRAMPQDAPRSLSDNQVYAATAYLLYINGIIGEQTEISAQTLPEVRMPNREGFVRIWLGDGNR